MPVKENGAVGVAQFSKAEQVVFELWHNVARSSVGGGYAGEVKLRGGNGSAAFSGGRLDCRGRSMWIRVEQRRGRDEVMVRCTGVRNGCGFRG